MNGEMYHEKAVNFLGELFTNWKNQACSHDVTIALFSRIFYEAESREDFPSSISERIQDNKSENKDRQSRFYEDFYRVIYQASILFFQYILFSGSVNLFRHTLILNGSVFFNLVKNCFHRLYCFIGKRFLE